MKTARPRPPAARARRRGFTLVEVLVALVSMAILAALAWRGLDGMLRARDGTGAALERVLRVDTAVIQWEQDLQALVDVVAVPALAFNGQTLLLTRRADDGVVVVAWAVRGGRWQRWAAPAVTKVGELQDAWLRAQSLLGNEAGQITVAEAAAEWQLYKYIGGRKANMQSAGNIVEAPAPAPGASAPARPGFGREALPEAVEMTVTLDGRKLTRVIALGPVGGG